MDEVHMVQSNLDSNVVMGVIVNQKFNGLGVSATDQNGNTKVVSTSDKPRLLGVYALGKTEE